MLEPTPSFLYTFILEQCEANLDTIDLMRVISGQSAAAGRHCRSIPSLKLLCFLSIQPHFSQNRLFFGQL